MDAYGPTGQKNVVTLNSRFHMEKHGVGNMLVKQGKAKWSHKTKNPPQAGYRFSGFGAHGGI